MTKWYFIRPIDTLFFRDGKPFEFGIENYSFSIFPPSPRTFYGALRTYIILSHSSLNSYKKDEKLLKIVGDENNFGNLRIYGPIIAKKIGSYIEMYFPIPKDVMLKETFIEKRAIYLKPQEIEEANFNLDKKINLVIPEQEEDLEEVEGYFSNSDMEDYLSEKSELGEKLEKIAKDSSNIYKHEHRVGIKINKERGTVEPHYLYSSPHLRLGIFNTARYYGFIVGIDGDEGLVNNRGIFRLGGDTRVVELEELEEGMIEKIFSQFRLQIIEKIKNSKRFKMILLTPAIFQNGWYPDFLNISNDELKGKWEGIEIKLVGCILGKPKYLGGFDLVKQTPKSIKKVIPPGSVYFFEIINDTNIDWDNIFNNYFPRSIDNSDLSKEGFQLILLGGW